MKDSDIDFVMRQTQVDQVMAFSAPRQVGSVTYELDSSHPKVPYPSAFQGCPFRTDYNCLEYTHGNAHIFVGGDMYDTSTSANDPIFFLHHCFIDYIWEQWRQQRQVGLNRYKVAVHYRLRLSEISENLRESMLFQDFLIT